MGLDVLLYDKNDKRIGMYEITEALHNEIFNSKKLWRSYLELRKISEYYRSDEEYEGQALIELINDLKRYQMFISENKQREYQEFITEISHPSIRKVFIVGD
ncbi:hypothetical protein SAMN05444673_4115 [Bacillus sp. OV166]|uniref:hypothetical protein n=1 Tax=Bacillus sp. OV166 TaxID=1882763 RepID=UPI000A2AB424|nr:hypothetical protein [Bacillus sp. OV166]SMQ81062.1 hypothetical protein SAMN05444673_4115 [Bacillus sp. OV166]